MKNPKAFKLSPACLGILAATLDDLKFTSEDSSVDQLTEIANHELGYSGEEAARLAYHIIHDLKRDLRKLEVSGTNPKARAKFTEVPNVRKYPDALAAYHAGIAATLTMLEEIGDIVTGLDANADKTRINYADAGAAIRNAIKLEDLRDSLAGIGEYAK